MTFEEALKYLSDLEPRGWRLGLERMQEFVKRADLMDSIGQGGGPQYIHVAGTNGKGSVTAFAQSMLLAAGHRTGAFFSPYVIDPLERVWFGTEMISRQDFADSIQRLKAVSESLDDSEFAGVTEFEMKTAVGFDHWKRSKADWVALEVGLGGRFDATNVVTSRASVIVSIGMDHVSILGDSLGKIAFEKAGIVKPQTPLILGDVKPEAREAIVKVAADAAAPVWEFGRELRLQREGDGTWRLDTPRSSVLLRPSLYGEIQGHNAALAYASLEVSGAGSGQQVADGAFQAKLPGRFHRVEFGGRHLVLDGAHNAEAAQSLREMIGNLMSEMPNSRLVLLAGMVAGHDPYGFFQAFGHLVDEVHLVPIDSPRATSPAELENTIRPLFRNVCTYESFEEGLNSCLAGTTASDLLLITGSFYLVGQALRTVAGQTAKP